MESQKGYVYVIYNKLTDKFLFGETNRDVNIRLKEHLDALRKGTERNKAIQKDWLEYGENAFIFEMIIETSERKLCELVLIELYSRIGLVYKQRRGDGIEEIINGEKKISDSVYNEIEAYIHKRHRNSHYYKDMLIELQDMRTEFKCKSKDIYNRNFKNQFLEKYDKKTQRVIQVLLGKICKFEVERNKDLYNFTFEEAEEILYSLKATTLRSLQNTIPKLNKYLELAMEQGISDNKINYYKNLGKKENSSKYLLGGTEEEEEKEEEKEEE